MDRKIKTAWTTLEPGPENSFPEIVHVVVEISKGSKEKYELDKDRGILFLDRDLFGSMIYPGDYGMVPQTLCDDGDPVDALVLVSQPHHPGIVIPCRPVGLMEMEDEKGKDDKVLCVPADKVDPFFKNVRDIEDVSSYLLAEIKNFFEHYKDLEDDKWVKIENWQGAEKAKRFIEQAARSYKEKND